MIKQEVRVLEGFEKTFEELVSMRNGIEEEIRKKVEEKAQKIDKVIAEITEIVEVEVPDEVVEEPVVEETQTY